MALMQNLIKQIEEDLFTPQYLYEPANGVPESSIFGQYAAFPITVSL